MTKLSNLPHQSTDMFSSQQQFVFLACLVLGATAASADLRSRCKEGKDPLACIKYKSLELIQETSAKSEFEVMDGVKLVKRREAEPTNGVLEGIEEIADSHDLEVDLGSGAKLTASAADETVSLKLSGEKGETESRGKKHKLRRVLVPLLVFVLLKAMTLIPLALGVLGLKAWNALQLSFFSFVTSLALAIFNLFKKVASESPVPVAHTFAEPYHYAARNLIVPGGESTEEGQQLAYAAYQTQ